ncbi:MAG: T9SS type A sorting domain-containing protein, partial [Flammeovirgaceae bacterium]
QIKANELSWWTGGNKKNDSEVSYQNNQSSTVNLDQCLDIYSLKRPMISFNYWSDFELNQDGAVAQYSSDNGKTWQNVKIDSLKDAGINWFNGETILANPGQQKIQVPFKSFGWTSRTNGWRRAAYNLDMIAKEKRDTVRFRIAMATGSTNASDDKGNSVYDGFAFNNMYIGEKKRQVLVEHFTNSKDVASQKADAYLDALVRRQESLRDEGNADFNSIRYYVENGNTDGDPLHLDNPTDPSQRAAVYGVTRPPSTFMGGRSFGNITEDIANKFNYKVIDRRALQPPKFTLRLDTVATGNSTTITPRLTITSDTIVNASLVAQVALIENNVKEDKYGSRTYQNVLRKLLFGSDPTKRDGVNISSDYFNKAGITRTIEQTVNIDTYISNGNNLMLVGFVLDNFTGENYRSIVIKASKKIAKKVDPITGMDDTLLESPSLNMYPNPVANGKLYLSVPQEFLPTGNWKIADQRGVFVEKGDFESSVEGIKTIDVSHLANGVYFVWISAEGRTPIYRKLVIINRQ